MNMKKFREYVTEITAFSDMPASTIWAGVLASAGWGSPKISGDVITWGKTYRGSLSKGAFHYSIIWDKKNPTVISLVSDSPGKSAKTLRTDKTSLIAGGSPRTTLQKWDLVVNQDLRQADIDARK